MKLAGKKYLENKTKSFQPRRKNPEVEGTFD